MDRIIPGLLLAVAWLVLLLKGSAVLFSIIMLGVFFIAANEYLRMATPESLGKRERLFLNLTLMLPCFAVTFSHSTAFIVPSLILSFFLLTGYFFYRYAKFQESYAFFSRLSFGLLYVGLLGSHILLLRFMPDGEAWLLIASAITASADSGAYFVGCSIGKHKLCPQISPKKTIEGALGGLFFAIIAAFATAYLFLPEVTPWALALGATVLTCAGMAGDLAESVIKRGTGTKDSGTCLGGHGGVLDRIDSLLFAVPILYTALTF